MKFRFSLKLLLALVAIVGVSIVARERADKGDRNRALLWVKEVGGTVKLRKDGTIKQIDLPTTRINPRDIRRLSAFEDLDNVRVVHRAFRPPLRDRHYRERRALFEKRITSWITSPEAREAEVEIERRAKQDDEEVRKKLQERWNEMQKEDPRYRPPPVFPIRASPHSPAAASPP